MFQIIHTKKDIDRFQDAVNGLHDGYLIGVEYVHRGISGGNPCWIDPEKTELRLRYLVTSIYDAVVELRFAGVRSFQLRENGNDVIECFADLEPSGILWRDDEDESGSWVRAQEMSWKILKE